MLSRCRSEEKGFWGLLNITTLLYLRAASKLQRWEHENSAQSKVTLTFVKNKTQEFEGRYCKDDNDSKAIIITPSGVKPMFFEHQSTMNTAGNRLQMKYNLGFFV